MDSNLLVSIGSLAVSFGSAGLATFAYRSTRVQTRASTVQLIDSSFSSATDHLINNPKLRGVFYNDEEAMRLPQAPLSETEIQQAAMIAELYCDAYEWMDYLEKDARGRIPVGSFYGGYRKKMLTGSSYLRTFILKREYQYGPRLVAEVKEIQQTQGAMP